PYGQGRVVVIEGAGMWRWAFLPASSQQQEQVYATLWHSLVRWLTSGGGLSPGQKMNLRADKVRFATSESATVTLVTRGETNAKLPLVKLASEGAPPQEFRASAAGTEAGLFRVNFGKLPAGHYRANIVGQD